jgi:hypothetical protein
MQMAIALKNQNVILTNIGKQIYSSIHRNEHGKI